jgi:hypothetical protein
MNRSKLILLTSAGGEDYLADLFLSSILMMPSISIFTNYIPPYLYDDYPLRDSLYGKGFSVFCTLSRLSMAERDIHLMSEGSLVSLASNAAMGPFTVVYTSIWRYSDLIDAFAELDSVVRLIALDGEDHTRIHAKSSKFAKYYKRELIAKESNLFPISFALPPVAARFCTYGSAYLPKKSSITAQCDPRFRPSYVFSTEKQYYAQYESALFAVTTKKGGWDCMRHYEILANHCVPYFPDIEAKPPLTMCSYPVSLQISANRLYTQVVLGSRALDAEFWEHYGYLLRGLLTYFYENCLSTVYRGIVRAS